MVLIAAFVFEAIRKKFELKNVIIIIYFLILGGNVIHYTLKTSKYYSLNKEYLLDLNNILTKTNENVYKKNLNIFSNSSLINQYFIHKDQKFHTPTVFLQH